MRITRREWVLDLYNFCLGAFLLASPWLFAMTRQSAMLETWGAGALLVVVSAAALLAFSLWEEWLSLLIGLWMIVSPFALGFEHTRAMNLNIGLGIAVAFFATIELFLVYDRTHADAPASPKADAPSR